MNRGQTEPGGKERTRQQIGVDRQMGKEDIMTKIRGKTQQLEADKKVLEKSDRRKRGKRG